MTLRSPFSSGRFFPAVLTLGVVVTSALSCLSCKEDAPQKPPPAPKVEPKPPQEPKPASVDPRQLAAIRRAANALFAQSDFDGAKEKVEAGLALDPDFGPLLRLQKRIENTLANRCCGKWLRYDMTKPEAKKKHIRGVLYSENLGKNYRGHLFRSRVLMTCEEGKASMTVLVPWDVPESPTVSVSYELGEEKGTDQVKTEVKKLGYIFEDAKSWWEKLGQHQSENLEFELPKKDGSKGKFVFAVGEAKKLMDELRAACP